MSDDERELPRSAGERWLLGLVSLIFGIPLGLGTLVVFLTPMPELGALGTLFLFATRELLLAITVVLVFTFIWAVAMPPWVEKLYRSAWEKLFWVILLANLPLIIFMILADYGIKPGDVLGP